MQTSSIELEQYFLGACLGNKRHLDNVAALKPEHFENELHQRIFSCMIDSANESDIVDCELVHARLKGDGELFSYLGSLWGKGYACMNIKPYTQQLLGQADIREKKRLIEEALEDTDKLKNLSEDLQNSDIEDSALIQFKSTDEVYKNIYDGLESGAEFFSTGIDVMDDSMEGGLYKSKTYCIAARPKVGKTVTLATVSHNLNKAGVKHLYIAAEMSAEEILQRCIAYDLNRNPTAFRDKNDASFRQKVADYRLAHTGRKAIFVNSPSITFDKLKKAIISAHRRGELQGVILDYLQLVTGRDKTENDAQFQSVVAQWLAEIAKKLNIFVLYAAQLNRDNELRGSDGIKMAVDQLYCMHGNTILDKDGKNIERRWFTLEATRYTSKVDVGSEATPLLRIAKTAPVLVRL